MYLAKFLQTTHEEKYAIRKDKWNGMDDWHVAHPSYGMGRDRIAEQKKVRLFRRIKERDVVFFEEKTSFYFDVDDNVRVNNEVVKVTKVIKTLDGAIEYYTDRQTITQLNTRETYFDEQE